MPMPVHVVDEHVSSAADSDDTQLAESMTSQLYSGRDTEYRMQWYRMQILFDILCVAIPISIMEVIAKKKILYTVIAAILYALPITGYQLCRTLTISPEWIQIVAVPDLFKTKTKQTGIVSTQIHVQLMFSSFRRSLDFILYMVFVIPEVSDHLHS